MDSSSVKQRSNLKKNGSAQNSQALPKPKQSAEANDASLNIWTPALILAWGSTLAYIFGGCCSNVWTLESIIKHEQDAGFLITFTQFVLTTFASCWPHVQFSARFPYVLRQPKVPLIEWLPNILLFASVNVLNNIAFGYRISVPVHIILRSGGSVTTMLVGSLMGRRYTAGQTAGVALLTAGVVTAAMADAQTKGKMGSGSETDMQSFGTGLSIIFIAQLLSALMGIRTQAVYAKHGPQWQENLFYSHLLSVPFFLLFPSKILEPLSRLRASDMATISYRGLASIQLPQQVIMLLANASTQLVCILGVNRLGAVTTALGVTIVLNVRKLVSLFLSTWIFGNELPPFVWVGAALVFAGGGVYAGGDRWLQNRKPKNLASKKEL